MERRGPEFSPEHLDQALTAMRQLREAIEASGIDPERVNGLLDAVEREVTDAYVETVTKASSLLAGPETEVVVEEGKKSEAVEEKREQKGIIDPERRYAHQYFDVKDFYGKRLTRVAVELPPGQWFANDEDGDEIEDSDDAVNRILNDYQRETFGRNQDAQVLLSVEGIQGVVVGSIDQGDGWRSNFGGWSLIPELQGEEIEDLGRVRDVKASGYQSEGRIVTEKRRIVFGTDDSDDYYPHGYVSIS